MKLIFLHYFGGSIRSWDLVIDSLRGEVECLALDVPGFGDAPALSDHQTVDEVADVLAGRINAWAAGEPIALMGHSMGGKIALALAAGTSERPALTGLRALVLMAPSPPGPEPIPDDARQQLLAKPNQTPEQRRSAAEQTVAKITNRPVPDSIRQQIITDDLRASLDGWVAWASVGSREDITARMAGLTIPISIMAGDQDRALAVSVQAEQVLPHLPQARLQVIAGVGHLLPYEVPVEVVACIRKALQAVSQ